MHMILTPFISKPLFLVIFRKSGWFIFVLMQHWFLSWSTSNFETALSFGVNYHSDQSLINESTFVHSSSTLTKIIFSVHSHADCHWCCNVRSSIERPYSLVPWYHVTSMVMSFRSTRSYFSRKLANSYDIVVALQIINRIFNAYVHFGAYIGLCLLRRLYLVMFDHVLPTSEPYLSSSPLNTIQCTGTKINIVISLETHLFLWYTS